MAEGLSEKIRAPLRADARFNSRMDSDGCRAAIEFLRGAPGATWRVVKVGERVRIYLDTTLGLTWAIEGPTVSFCMTAHLIQAARAFDERAKAIEAHVSVKGREFAIRDDSETTVRISYDPPVRRGIVRTAISEWWAEQTVAHSAEVAATFCMGLAMYGPPAWFIVAVVLMVFGATLSIRERVRHP